MSSYLRVWGTLLCQQQNVVIMSWVHIAMHGHGQILLLLGNGCKASFPIIRLLNNKFYGLSPSGSHHSLLFDQEFPNNSRVQHHLANRNAIWRYLPCQLQGCTTFLILILQYVPLSFGHIIFAISSMGEWRVKNQKQWLHYLWTTPVLMRWLNND